MRGELLHQVALSLLPGIGPKITRQLISYCGSAENVFHTGVNRLSTIPGIGPKTAALIVSGSNSRGQAVEQIRLAKKSGTSIKFFTEKSFPFRLKNIDNAPNVLYTKGQPAFNNTRTLGIVGTRRASNYGRQIVSRLLTQLQPYGPTIISGLAYGIDISAHREALKMALPTIGVLGSGLDHIYPEIHKKTAEEMLSTGGLITELPFGSKPEMYHFPSRNRIIAGLSDALVVVEARKKGGALITVDYMRHYNKPCLAVPGPINVPTSNGSNQLIKDRKAHMLTKAEDITRLLGWTLEPVRVDLPSANKSLEDRVLEVLRNYSKGLHIDTLCWKTQTPINKMGVIILNLEFKGLIKSLPGKKFSLVSQ